MTRFRSTATLAALLSCALAPAALAASPEEERLLGCGCEAAQLQGYLPFTRTFGVSGIVAGGLPQSTASAGVPPAAMIEALAALGAGIDVEHEVRDGDRFYVRYEETFTAEGDPIGIARVLWAELRTAAKGVVAIHRFRPIKGTFDGFWLASGEATMASELRLPLEAITVSSGFGMRADPFDQPLRRTMQAAAGKPRLAPAGAPFGSPFLPDAPARAVGGPKLKPSPLTNPMVNTPAVPGLKLGLASAGPGQQGSAPRGSQGGQFSGFSSVMQMHEGVDLAAGLGTPIHAAGDGIVLGAELKGGYGNWVEIEHEGPPAPGKPSKLATVYGHLSAFAPGIAPGVEVSRGDVIGYVGSTGRSTGPHLHFEILSNGHPTNPMVSQSLRREQLRGGELERFKRQVAKNLQERDREARSM